MIKIPFNIWDEVNGSVFEATKRVITLVSKESELGLPHSQILNNFARNMGFNDWSSFKTNVTISHLLTYGIIIVGQNNKLEFDVSKVIEFIKN